jgi:hypothetical protein
MNPTSTPDAETGELGLEPRTSYPSVATHSDRFETRGALSIELLAYAHCSAQDVGNKIFLTNLLGTNAGYLWIAVRLRRGETPRVASASRTR